jgi:MYXO-CTERM domain-containing protein
VEPLLVNAGSEFLLAARISGSLGNSITGEQFPFSPLDVTPSGARMEPMGIGIDYPADLPAGAYRVTLSIEPETSTTETWDSNNTWVSRDTVSLSPNPAEAGNYRLAVWLRGADLDGSVILFEGDDGTLAVAAYSLGAGASIREPDLTLGTDGTLYLEDNGFGLTLTLEDDDWSLVLEDTSLVATGFSVANGTRSMDFAAGVYLPDGHRAGSPGTMAIISPNGEIIVSMDGSIPGDYSIPSYFTAPGHYELQSNGGSADMAWDASRWTLSLDIDPGDGTALDPIYLRAPDPPESPDTGDTSDTGDTGDTGDTSVTDTDTDTDTGDPSTRDEPDNGGPEARCGCTSSPNPRTFFLVLASLGLLLSARRRQGTTVDTPAKNKLFKNQ